MPRSPRIEYPGAVYHVMNRGDRGQTVFRDEIDHEQFVSMMWQVCKRADWRVHAYVLMRSHFHMLLETPKGNLVSGMTWFLGAYSQRFNARHEQRGHVFQGRYKALPVETGSGTYFETVSGYIHLNPARGGLVARNASLSTYKWSSYPAYVSRAGGRKEWLVVERVLANLGLRDDETGRSEYRRHIEARRRGYRTKKGREELGKECAAIRRGWYLGSDAFREKLITLVEDVVEGRQSDSYSGEAMVRMRERRAERLVRKGVPVLGLRMQDLPKLPKGHEAKCVLAWLVHTRTMASHKWLAARLAMGVPSNMTTYIDRARRNRSPRIRALRAEVERRIPG